MAADELDYESFEQQFEESAVQSTQKPKFAFKKPSKKIMIGAGIVGAILVIAFLTQVFANVDYSRGGYAVLQPSGNDFQPTTNIGSGTPITKTLDIGYFGEGDVTYSPDSHVMQFTYQPKGGEESLVIDRLIYNNGIPAPETAIRITDFSSKKTITLPAYQWNKGVPLKFTLTANGNKYVSTYLIKGYTTSSGKAIIVIHAQKI